MIESNVLAGIAEEMALAFLGCMGFTVLVVGVIAYGIGYFHGKRKPSSIDHSEAGREDEP